MQGKGGGWGHWCCKVRVAGHWLEGMQALQAEGSRAALTRPPPMEWGTCALQVRFYCLNMTRKRKAAAVGVFATLPAGVVAGRGRTSVSAGLHARSLGFAARDRRLSGARQLEAFALVFEVVAQGRLFDKHVVDFDRGQLLLFDLVPRRHVRRRRRLGRGALLDVGFLSVAPTGGHVTRTRRAVSEQLTCGRRARLTMTGAPRSCSGTPSTPTG